MTREEALVQLRIGPGINEDVSEEYNEAVDIAIEALKTQPSEDCISRKAAIDGLASIAKVKAKSDSQKSLMGRVMFFTEHLPSVTPQPKEEPKADVLDKIRVEIEALKLLGYATVDGRREIASRAVMQIIDKYKAESEDKK